MKEERSQNQNAIMMPQYLLYNNIGLVMSIVMMMTKRHQKVNIAQIAIFLPLLLDDNVVKRANSPVAYKILNLAAIDRVNIANMNDRYRQALLVLVNALSVLQDFDAVRINKDVVEYIPNNKLEGMLEGHDCERFLKIKEAYYHLWPSQQDMGLAELYHLLGIII